MLSNGVVAAFTALLPKDSSPDFRALQRFRLPWRGSKVSGSCFWIGMVWGLPSVSEIDACYHYLSGGY